jgi:tetratricopeptide (TPR) repeat protein
MNDLARTHELPRARARKRKRRQPAAPPLPSIFLTHFERGARALEKGEIIEAESHWSKAAQQNPAIWGALANQTLRSGDLQGAVALYSKILDATDVDPKIKALTLNDIGMAFSRMGSREMAATCFQQAYDLHKHSFEILCNLGLAAAWEGDFERKIKLLDACTRLKPDFHDAHFARATALLTLGRYREGFREYEARWKGKHTKLRKPALGAPELPSPAHAAGRNLFLYAEQGVGDTIQMLRYVRALLDLYPNHVTLWAQPGVASLVRNVFPAVNVITHYDDTIAHPDLPRFHYSAPLMSLPKIFGTAVGRDIPPAPYIPTPEPLHLEHGRFKVGLAWAGSPDHVDDRWRSIPLVKFAPILKFGSDSVAFYSLQVGARTQELVPMAERFTIHEIDLPDYTATARAIAALDLVISVDTSVVHLAGAMGKPVWMLTPHCPDWRWLLNIENSPWYQSLTLFRQPNPGDWETPIQNIAGRLPNFLAAKHYNRA